MQNGAAVPTTPRGPNAGFGAGTIPVAPSRAVVAGDTQGPLAPDQFLALVERRAKRMIWGGLACTAIAVPADVLRLGGLTSHPLVVALVAAPLLIGGLVALVMGWSSLRLLPAARRALEMPPLQLALFGSKTHLLLMMPSGSGSSAAGVEASPVATFRWLLWTSRISFPPPFASAEVYGDLGQRGPVIVVSEPVILLGRTRRSGRSYSLPLRGDGCVRPAGPPLGPFMAAGPGTAILAFGLIAANASAFASLLSILVPILPAEALLALSLGAWLVVVFSTMMFLAQTALARAAVTMPPIRRAGGPAALMWSNSSLVKRPAAVALAAAVLALLAANPADFAPTGLPSSRGAPVARTLGQTHRPNAGSNSRQRDARALRFWAILGTFILLGTTLVLPMGYLQQETRRRQGMPVRS
jgi:hypothetical protein